MMAVKIGNDEAQASLLAAVMDVLPVAPLAKLVAEYAIEFPEPVFPWITFDWFEGGYRLAEAQLIPHPEHFDDDIMRKRPGVSNLTRFRFTELAQLFRGKKHRLYARYPTACSSSRREYYLFC